MDQHNAAQNETNHPIIYLIRHGEKPPKVDGEDQIGLSTQGLSRAQGIVQVFGNDSRYNIGLIIAQHPKESGKQARPWDTVKGLAQSLAPNVQVNHKIHRDDAQGVSDAIKQFKGPGNVLVCWEHARLTDIVKAIGIQNAPTYPKERFDKIWIVEHPYDKIDTTTSQHIPGLDDAFAHEP